MRVPVGAAGEARRDHRLAERLERARDVDPLAARHGGLLDRAMSAPKPEVGHREGLVDRRVEGDGDDHAIPLERSWRRRRRTARRRRRTNWRLASASALRITTISVRLEEVVAALPARRPPRSPLRVTSGTLAIVRPRQRTSIVPTRDPAGSGPSSSLRDVEHADGQALAAPCGAHDGARRHELRALVAVGELDAWRTASPLAHRPGAVIAAQAVADERQRVLVARRLAGLVEDDRDDRDARSCWPRPRGCSPRVEVWPVLTPLTSGTARTSRLRLRIVRGCDAGAQRRARQVGHRAEERVAAQDQGQLDQVLGARVVAQRVEADRVGVVGVGQPELARAAVHQRDEGAVASRRRAAPAWPPRRWRWRAAARAGGRPPSSARRRAGR